jgi:hypothetical protein
MNAARQELPFAFRQLRRNPGFTAIAAITLALGIGANGAIFSVVHAVLWSPLPYRSPERLVVVTERIPLASPEPIPLCAPDEVALGYE